MTSASHNALSYREEIDGLRAIAVLSVIFFHVGVGTFSGGFVGVDVFFVISEYLITHLILDGVARSKFTFADFYERRARRILPALFLVMGVTVPLAWWTLAPADLIDYAKSVTGVVTFSSNFLFAFESGYFEPDVELKPLLHTWSLAVEEQYYLIFPVVLWLLRRQRRTVLLGVLGTAACASLAVSIVLTPRAPAFAFYLLPPRTFELLSGAVLAIVSSSSREFAPGVPRPMRTMLSWIGLASIVSAVILFDETVAFPGVAALLPVVGTGLVIAFADFRTSVGRILGSAPVRGLGLISYSAYLWHQPLVAFARIRKAAPLSSFEAGALILLTLSVGFASDRHRC